MASNKFEQYEQELKQERDTLEKQFTASQGAAEAAWAAYDKDAEALTTFRAKYDGVLKALETRAVTVTSDATTGGVTAKGGK